MQDEQLQLIDVAADPLPEPTPKPATIYLVAAYRAAAFGGGWKIHRETNDHEYTSREAAVTAAGKLSSHWTHRTILSVSLA